MRDFLKYAFNRLMRELWSLITSLTVLAVAACTVEGYYSIAMVVGAIYIIFFGLFLIINYADWLKYKKFNR
ncbi:hypothetical protein WSM22_03180 [Cytophagales bacterium WSM2-2]|nr:hypothetical protein WSM22_03180 [Cytophagales bacterium WSM2-2]